jgi:magnesium-transporting ATPase (P-type)
MQKYGPGYDEKVKEENLKEGKELAVKYTEAHEIRVANAEKAFTMYSAVAKFAATSVDDYATRVQSHVKELEAASSSADFQSTNNRRTFYLNQERNTVEWWDTLLTMLIVAVSLVYAYHFFFINKQYKNVFLWFVLLVLLLVSYLLPMVVNWIVRIPRAVNVYTSWAETEAPEWHGGDM